MSLIEDCSTHLSHLAGNSLLRSIPLSPAEGVLNLAGNDYMGLALHSEELHAEFERLSPRPAMTSSASRLLASDQHYHTQFERYLEELYGRPALLFNSGYHANTGCISALAALPSTLLVADKLAHASMIDGLILSRSPFKRFRHNDTESLRRILRQAEGHFSHVVVITESVFSMDGDIAPLKELVALKREFPFMAIYLDEAHGFGCFGKRGLGLAEQEDVIDDIDIIVCTLGKAAASEGAFIIAAEPVRDFLLNTARSFIFSTALSPASAAYSMICVGKLTEMDDERRHLRSVSERVREALPPSGSQSQIVPWIVGSAERALRISARLRDIGINALAIRRPTVPHGTERIRFSLNAALTDSDVLKIISAIKSL